MVIRRLFMIPDRDFTGRHFSRFPRMRVFSPLYAGLLGLLRMAFRLVELAYICIQLAGIPGRKREAFRVQMVW